VAGLGERPGRPAPPLFLVTKEEITEGRKASRASKTKLPPPPPPSLAQGLDLPLITQSPDQSWLSISECSNTVYFYSSSLVLCILTRPAGSLGLQ